MTTATDLATQWDSVVDEFGNTATLYNPTVTYNDEGDVSAYTLDAGTSVTIICIEGAVGDAYESQVEGVDNRKTFRVLAKTTESLDNESILSISSDKYEVVGGSIRKITFDDTVISQRLIIRKMLLQEAAKIA
jgi:hypothetical protein